VKSLPGLSLLAALLLTTLAHAEVRPGPWPLQGYPCQRIAHEIVIDGKLDEAIWSAAPWTRPFVDIEGDIRPDPRHETRARMLWDDTYFYVAAQMDEPHLWATLRERDSVIYYDNDFEVFIDPDGDSHLYTEIELNAFNTVWDLLLIKPYRNGGPAIHAWDIPGLRTAVHLDGSVNDPSDTDRGWSVEIAIPWAVLKETTSTACPPNPGDRWRVNFSRVQWQLETVDGAYRKMTDPLTGKSLPENNWVWSQQRVIAMHEPEHWGIVEFRAADNHTPVLPDDRDAAAWHLRFAAYYLAELRSAGDTWPETFAAPAPAPGTPDLDPAWNWPPAYVRTGGRYTLTLTRSDNEEALILHEDGRLVHDREK